MTYTIRPRGRGFLATVHNDNQRHRRVFHTRADAERWASSLDSTLDGKHPWFDGSFKSLIDHVWETHYSKMRHAKKHRVTLNQLESTVGSKTPVSEVNTTPFIERVKDYLMNEKKLKGTSVNRLLSFLRTCLNNAQRKGLIGSVCDFHWAKAQRSTRKSLTNSQARAIRNYLYPLWTSDGDAKSMLYEVFIVLVSTGLRFNEAIAITFDDIDWEKRTLTITTGKHPNSPSAVIPLGGEVFRLFRLMYNVAGDKTGLVFGHWKTYDSFRKAWQLALSRIDNSLIGMTLHCLRHTFCSRLVAEGIPLVRVKELARHSSITTTMMYTHAAPKGDDDEVIKALSLE